MEDLRSPQGEEKGAVEEHPEKNRMAKERLDEEVRSPLFSVSACRFFHF